MTLIQTIELVNANPSNGVRTFFSPSDDQSCTPGLVGSLAGLGVGARRKLGFNLNPNFFCTCAQIQFASTSPPPPPKATIMPPVPRTKKRRAAGDRQPSVRASRPVVQTAPAAPAEPKPLSASATFGDLALPASLQNAVTEIGLKTLTSLQRKTIPGLLVGKDVRPSQLPRAKTKSLTRPRSS